MKLSLVIVVVVGLIQCQEGESKCFAQLCYGNPGNQIRGCDPHGLGCGYYGARRTGGRKHPGIDIVCTAGLWVWSPIPAEVTGEVIVYPYGDKNYDKPFNTGIALEGTGAWDGYEVLLFYVSKEVDSGEEVDAGDFVGYSIDRTVGSPGMTQHVHLQMYKNGRRVDPTPYVC
ncbi:leukocyte cell-derived chemotaxin-2-like [Oculina patagonica]